MEKAKNEKAPLIRLLWKGLAHYGLYYNLDLPNSMGDIAELLDIDYRLYDNDKSLYLFPVTPAEIEKPLLAAIEERTENTTEDGDSVRQKLVMALFLQLEGALSPAIKGLEKGSFKNWKEKQTALYILDAFGPHDEKSHSIARRYLEDDDSDVQMAAVLLLSRSENAEDLDALVSALQNIGSDTLVSRLYPLLYKFSEQGRDVLPLLESLYSGMNDQDYLLIARFVLTSKREELFDYLIDKDDQSLHKALTLELYRNAYDYRHFYSKALELAEKWVQGSEKDTPLTYLLAFITLLTESEEIRTKYASYGEWMPRGGAIMGLAASKSIGELEELYENEDDEDVQSLIRLVIQVKSAGDELQGPIHTYLDIKIRHHILNTEYEGYKHLVMHAPHLPALRQLPTFAFFHTLQAEIPYEEKVKTLSGYTDLLSALMEEHDYFDLFNIPGALLFEAEEAAGLVAAGIDSEEARDYLEERFLTENIYDEAHSYLLALKNTGEPRSFAARTKEKLHRFGGKGITPEEFLSIQHIFHQTNSINDDYSSIISELPPHYFTERPAQLLIYIRFKIGWENVDELISDFDINAMPQTDVPSLENLRRLFTNQYARVSEFTSTHILPKALMNSSEFARSFIHLIPPEEIFESPYFHYALIGGNVPDSVVSAMLSSFDPKSEHDQLHFFISNFASSNDWEVRQSVGHYIAKYPQLDLFDVVKKLLTDGDYDVREAAGNAFTAVSALDPLNNKVFLLERDNREVEEVVSSMREKQEAAELENPDQHKGKKVMIELFDTSKMDQLGGKKALSPDQWYGLCFSMQIDFHDEKTGSIIAHVGEEETEEIVNVLLEERELVLFVPSWV